MSNYYEALKSPCCCSDRRLGRSEGSEQRRVLQLGEARVGGVEEDEACTGEEVGSSSLSLIIIIIISTTVIVISIILMIVIIRWAAATQISHKLFSYCVQKRS